MSFDEVLRYRRLAMEDAWNIEAEIRKLPDLKVNYTLLRKSSWTIHCEATYFSTVRKIFGAIRLRQIPIHKPLAQQIQKTRGNRHVFVFDLSHGGRIRIIAKNACFDRKEPVDKTAEWSQQGNGKYTGNCAEVIKKT